MRRGYQELLEQFRQDMQSTKEERLLEAVVDCLNRKQTQRAAALLEQVATMIGEDDPDVVYLRSVVSRRMPTEVK